MIYLQRSQVKSNIYMKNIILIIIVVGALGAGIFITLKPQKSVKVHAPVINETYDENPVNTSTSQVSTHTPTPTTPSQPIFTTPTPPKVNEYSREAVALHASQNDCWTIIDSKIYNLTEWISKHPGGSRAILRLCGTDGTEAFSRQHGSSQKAQQALASFFIANVFE